MCVIWAVKCLNCVFFRDLLLNNLLIITQKKYTAIVACGCCLVTISGQGEAQSHLSNCVSGKKKTQRKSCVFLTCWSEFISNYNTDCSDSKFWLDELYLWHTSVARQTKTGKSYNNQLYYIAENVFRWFILNNWIHINKRMSYFISFYSL